MDYGLWILEGLVGWSAGWSAGWLDGGGEGLWSAPRDERG